MIVHLRNIIERLCKENYKHIYQTVHLNIEDLKLFEDNEIRGKNTNDLIISNFDMNSI
jgi:hypothetical protein